MRIFVSFLIIHLIQAASTGLDNFVEILESPFKNLACELCKETLEGPDFILESKIVRPVLEYIVTELCIIF